MAKTEKMRTEAGTSAGDVGHGGRGESSVTDVGLQESPCVYCQSGECTSISDWMWAESLTVDDYQALLDRGWTRSGCLLYKPVMEKICCPPYTIRLKASGFVPSKDQARASKRMQRFLDGSVDVEKPDKLTDEINTSGGSCSNAHHDSNSAVMESSQDDGDGKDRADQFMHFLADQVDNTVQLCMKSGEFSSDIQLPKASVKKVAPAKRKLKAENSEELVFSCNIAFQIAASLRRSKKDVEHRKPFEHGLRGVDNSGELSSHRIAEVLASHSKQLAESCGLSVRACNGHIHFYSSMKQAGLVEVGRGMISKTSPAGTGANGNHLKKSSGSASQGQQRRLEIRLKRSSFDYEEYSLYRKYQLTVHNDIPDESSYEEFLVDTPLVHVPPNNDGAVPPCGFGSFHQQYVLDGRLIAVSVIDILPKCLSSKYLFWDPDLAFLSLGKISALEEIKWVIENQAYCPSLQYYYLGFYIHSCSKMRYKAAYRPSELLCPLRYHWVPYDMAKPFLDRRRYVILSDYITLQNGDSLSPNDNASKGTSHDVSINEDKTAEVVIDFSNDESDSTTEALEDVDLSNVLIGLGETRLRFKDLQRAVDPSRWKLIESLLQRYARAVGKELSEQIVVSQKWVTQ